jgi:clan AA aspartic protease
MHEKANDFGKRQFNFEAVVRVHIEDVNGQTQAIDVKVDTGFTGYLSMPAAMVASLGLIATIGERVNIGDGSTVLVQVHAATVIWEGKARSIEVHAMGNERLIGMRMLASHDLSIRVQDGGPVSISLIP